MISVIDQQGSRPGPRLFSPSTACKVNECIKLPKDGRAAQNSLATSIMVIPLYNITLAMSLLAWFLSRVYWVSLCISRCFSSGINAVNGITQCGWEFVLI